jgi:ribosome-binding protein aMBF1 (putative translation factor)
MKNEGRLPTIVCRTLVSIDLEFRPMGNDSLEKRFGSRVREARLKLGYSQEGFAELVGVHRTYVGMIERGEKNITLRNIERFAHALGLDIAELVRGID